jgi:RNA polymerase sigma-70 factor (ECF subfamily)
VSSRTLAIVGAISVSLLLIGVAMKATSSPLEVLLEAERHRRMLAALHELPPKLKEAVLLRFDQGLDYPEIARILDAPESTIRSRVFLGIRQLRARTREDET